MEKDANLELKCAVCQSMETLKRCTRCKEAVYCCRQHQIQDWPLHKATCTPNRIGETKQKVEISNSKDTCEQTENSPKACDKQSDNVTEFDSRPFREIKFKKPESYDVRSLAGFVMHYLNKNNFCVVDGVFPNKILERALNEIKSLNSDGCLKLGRLSGGRTSGQDALKMTKTEIRNDMIHWAEGTEPRHPNINKVVKKMDSVLSTLNDLFQGKYLINGRTKVMKINFFDILIFTRC